MQTEEIRIKLLNTATDHDRKEKPKRGYNPHALGITIARIQEVMADIEAGTSPRKALIAGFNGRFLDKMLKSIGEPKFTQDEERGGSWFYVPASEK